MIERSSTSYSDIKQILCNKQITQLNYGTRPIMGKILRKAGIVGRISKKRDPRETQPSLRSNDYCWPSTSVVLQQRRPEAYVEKRRCPTHIASFLLFYAVLARRQEKKVTRRSLRVERNTFPEKHPPSTLQLDVSIRSGIHSLAGFPNFRQRHDDEATLPTF